MLTVKEFNIKNMTEGNQCISNLKEIEPFILETSI